MDTRVTRPNPLLSCEDGAPAISVNHIAKFTGSLEMDDITPRTEIDCHCHCDMSCEKQLEAQDTPSPERIGEALRIYSIAISASSAQENYKEFQQ